MGAVVCFLCQSKNEFSSSQLGFRETCVKCGHDLHVCLNCRFYDPGAYNECREPVAERVRDKEKSNFCEMFQPQVIGAEKKQPSREELWAQAEALFKKNK